MMKNLIQFVVFLFCPLLLFSQEYIPFVVEGNQWHHITSYMMPPGRCTTEIKRIEGDSIINGVGYKKLMATQDTAIDRQWEVYALLREDVQERKVYVKPNERNERLIYDFSLKEGDSIKTEFFLRDGDSIMVRLDSIGYIRIGDKEHRKYFLRTGINNEGVGLGKEWIEGIGNPVDGLFVHFPYASSSGTWILCFFKNDELYYKPNSYGYTECYYKSPGGVDIENLLLDKQLEGNLSVFGKNLVFESQASSSCSMKVYDPAGLLVGSVTGYLPGKLTVENLQSGIYLYEIEMNSEKYKGKIVVF